MKHCRKCNTTKSEDKFYKESHRGDGLALWCKLCKNEANNARAALRRRKYATDAPSAPRSDLSDRYPDKDLKPVDKTAPNPIRVHILLPVGKAG